MQMVQELLDNKECAKQIIVMANALQKYYSENERDVA